jgi:hypothetical protein
MYASNEKTDNTVQSILGSKHPNDRTPGSNVLTNHPYLTDFVDLNITKNSIIEIIAYHLSRGAGCSCAAAVAAAF